MLLYSMGSNCDLFGIGLFKYSEAQMYKKFMDVILIPPRRNLNSRMMNNIRFYARYLAIYAIKLKKLRVGNDGDYTGKFLVERTEKYQEFRKKQ
jgi:hypothetical protein